MPVETPVDDDAGPASVPVLEAFELSPSADIVGGYNSQSSKPRHFHAGPCFRAPGSQAAFVGVF